MLIQDRRHMILLKLWIFKNKNLVWFPSYTLSTSGISVYVSITDVGYVSLLIKLFWLISQSSCFIEKCILNILYSNLRIIFSK